MRNTEDYKKFKYLILIRIVLGFAILIVGASVLKIQQSEEIWIPFYFLVALLFILYISWLIILQKKLLSPSLHAKLLLYTELIIEIAIIHYSGGLNSNSPFIYLPLMSIISSAFLVSAKDVVIYSISAAILYVIASVLEFYQWMPDFLQATTKKAMC